jgi:hypothetical protein
MGMTSDVHQAGLLLSFATGRGGGPRHWRATRPEGAPLTVILAVRGCPARRTGQASLQVRPSVQRNGGVPLTCGSGPADLAAVVRPSGLPPERATWPPPRSRPAGPPLSRLWS